jgi:hypothetical protein
MQIDNTASKYQLTSLVFAQAEVAASQSAVALSTQEVHGGVALDNVGYTMPFAGEIVAVSANLSAAATGGSLAVVPTIGGTPVTDPALAITTQIAMSDTCRRGSNPFAKDAVIGVKITTAAGWTAETMDLLVVVWAIQTLGGI